MSVFPENPEDFISTIKRLDPKNELSKTFLRLLPELIDEGDSRWRTTVKDWKDKNDSELKKIETKIECRRLP